MRIKIKGLEDYQPNICTIEGDGASMLDLSAGGNGGAGGDNNDGGGGNQGGNGGQGGDNPRLITYNDQRMEVPEELWNKEAGTINAEAAVKRAMDLRHKLSQQEGNNKPPEKYDLVVPKDLAGKVEVSADNPRVSRFFEIALRHGVPQEFVNDVIAGELSDEAADFAEIEAARANAPEVFKEKLGEGFEGKLKELGQWGGKLFGNDRIAMKDGKPVLGADGTPQLSDVGMALEAMTSTPQGVLLLNAFKEKMGSAPIPSSNDNEVGGFLDEAALQKIMASDDYQAGDKELHAKVRAGYKRLYPE